MAEIKIEKKRPVWPWILLIIIILGILAYIFLYSDNQLDDDREDMDDIEELNEDPTTGIEQISFSEVRKMYS